MHLDKIDNKLKHYILYVVYMYIAWKLIQKSSYTSILLSNFFSIMFPLPPKAHVEKVQNTDNLSREEKTSRIFRWCVFNVHSKNKEIKFLRQDSTLSLVLVKPSDTRWNSYTQFNNLRSSHVYACNCFSLCQLAWPRPRILVAENLFFISTLSTNHYSWVFSLDIPDKFRRYH